MTKSHQSKSSRIESDSIGDVEVPSSALYGAQTQRAVDNFAISGWQMPTQFIVALGILKKSAAEANAELGHLTESQAKAIMSAAQQVIDQDLPGGLHAQFPIDVFQTGSGTSTNMNANEVIATLAQASSDADQAIHPNDHVNLGQSSNDVIPTTIMLSAALEVEQSLLPALEHLSDCLRKRETELKTVVKTGRTHLMDAMPVTMAQEISGWRAQVDSLVDDIKAYMPRFQTSALGGTAVGTGVNADPKFSTLVAVRLSRATGLTIHAAENHFHALSAQDRSLTLMALCKVGAIILSKIANDLRWMNSGPLAGLGEIQLPTLQPGSSIMPGKVNPVIPEAVCMAAAQIIGYEAAVTIAANSGNFQLNVMLPLVAQNLLHSIELLSNSAVHLADKAILGFTVNTENLEKTLAANPILVTALNAEIGYEAAAKIAKEAFASKQPIVDVAVRMTDIPRDRLVELLDPMRLTNAN